MAEVIARGNILQGIDHIHACERGGLGPGGPLPDTRGGALLYISEALFILNK
jgi:hypothetical protein